MSRLERIRALAESRPDDPFAWYSLAMEQKKTDVPGALALFQRVHDRHPAYVPNYYHYAKTLDEAGDAAAAVVIYREGITVARAAGDDHAASELSAALELLEG